MEKDLLFLSKESIRYQNFKTDLLIDKAPPIEIQVVAFISNNVPDYEVEESKAEFQYPAFYTQVYKSKALRQMLTIVL